MSTSLFSTGLSGLGVAQAALVTTGHNTANVATQGYSRQSVVIGVNPALRTSAGSVGSGARPVDVQRSHDAFLATQLNQAESSRESLAAHHKQISQIDNLLADSTAGLAPQLQTFFSHVQAVANTPADPAARQQMLSSAQALANQFRSMDQSLTRLDEGLNQELAGAVEQVNTLSGQIAGLNRQIAQLGNHGGTGEPNDLLDQRDQLLNDLSQWVGSRLVVQDGGSFNVFIGNGQPLVVGHEAYALRAVPSGADPTRQALALVSRSGSAVEMQAGTPPGGRIGGLVQFRAETLVPSQNALGRMAMGLADAFNAQQRVGRDLMGEMGTDLFATSGPAVLAHARNRGDLAVSATLADVGGLTVSDYRLRVTDAPGGLSYTLTRLQAPQPDVPVGSWSAADFPVTVDGVTLGLASGTAQAGDSFLVQPARQGARDLQVLLADPALVAAAGADSGAGAVSDGRNALLMGALQGRKLLGEGSATLGQAFSQWVSRVGNTTRQVEVALGAQTSLSLQIGVAQQSVSGVNQDEETANLLKFQQMYQANAKVIQAASQLFDAVLGIRS